MCCGFLVRNLHLLGMLGSNTLSSQMHGGPREMVSAAVASLEASDAPTETAGATEGERAIILSITERAR